MWLYRGERESGLVFDSIDLDGAGGKKMHAVGLKSVSTCCAVLLEVMVEVWCSPKWTCLPCCTFCLFIFRLGWVQWGWAFLQNLNVCMLCVSVLLEDGIEALFLIPFFHSNWKRDVCSAGLKSLYLVCGSALVGFMTPFCLSGAVCSNFSAAD